VRLWQKEFPEAATYFGAADGANAQSSLLSKMLAGRSHTLFFVLTTTTSELMQVVATEGL